MITFEDIIKQFDRNIVIDKYEEIKNQSFKAINNDIRSDGTYKTSISTDGYITIYNIDANFIIFFDINCKLTIMIYKHIDNAKLKNIENIKNLIKSPVTDHDDTEYDRVQKYSACIDINTFKCDLCGSQLSYKRTAKSPDILIGICQSCGAEFTFKPSKWYIKIARKIKYNNTKDERSIGLID